VLQLPEAVVDKLLSVDAGDLDLMVQHPVALQGQVYELLEVLKVGFCWLLGDLGGFAGEKKQEGTSTHSSRAGVTVCLRQLMSDRRQRLREKVMQLSVLCYAVLRCAGSMHADARA
jgi:hypothetical protein